MTRSIETSQPGTSACASEQKHQAVSAEDVARAFSDVICLRKDYPGRAERFYAEEAASICRRALALLPTPTKGNDAGVVGPGGWLIKDFADGWIWTDRRIAAVAALTDGHSVFDLNRQEYASHQAAISTDTQAEPAIKQQPGGRDE